jgi:hypothetical protein
VSNQKPGIAREAVRAAERIAGVEAATVEAAQCGTCGRALGLNPRDGIWTASGPAHYFCSPTCLWNFGITHRHAG